MTETLEELQLPREAVESESRGAIYSIPMIEDGGGASSTPEDPAEAPRTLQGNANPLSWRGLHMRYWGHKPSLMLGLWRQDSVLSILSSSVVQGLSPAPLPIFAFPENSTPNSLSLELFGLRCFPLERMVLFCLVSPLPHLATLD